MSLESDLEEWARWAGQGCQWGAGYPPESSTEHIAVPFKRSCTTEEQYDEFMSTRSADELIGARVDAWVRSLPEPERATIQVQYVHMPDSSRWPNLSHDQWQERRARYVARLWSQRCGERRVMTAEQFDGALGLAMHQLSMIVNRWAAGV